MNKLAELTKQQLFQLTEEYESLISTGILPEEAFVREVVREIYDTENAFFMQLVGLYAYRLLYLQSKPDLT